MRYYDHDTFLLAEPLNVTLHIIIIKLIKTKPQLNIVRQ